MSNTTEGEFSKDLLRGAAAIAEFLFGDRTHRRKVFYLAEKSRLPIFRLRSQLYARKTTLLKWIEDQENRRNNISRGDDPNDVDDNHRGR
jgi:hypothetical protein